MKHYILVHGAWEESRIWDDVTPVLEAQGHTVTALDLPGHGSNSQPIYTSIPQGAEARHETP